MSDCWREQGDDVQGVDQPLAESYLVKRLYVLAGDDAFAHERGVSTASLEIKEKTSATLAVCLSVQNGYRCRLALDRYSVDQKLYARPI